MVRRILISGFCLTGLTAASLPASAHQFDMLCWALSVGCPVVAPVKPGPTSQMHEKDTAKSQQDGATVKPKIIPASQFEPL